MLKTITILTILTLIYGLDIDFEPVNVWKYFQQLSATPRPSYYHYKVVSFLKNYGDANNFTVRQDRIGNLAIEIPSTVKRDKIPKVCLQAHYDMVAEKNDDKEFDFEHDAIELIRDGEWIRANMTTLGADDGIGVAVALAVATDKNSRHGPLELVFTKDEEVGLLGAKDMSKELLSCDYLLNLDNSIYGTIFIGSAGGENTVGVFVYSTIENKDYIHVEILISGLQGGHSGNAIHKNYGNSIKIMASLLHTLIEHNIEFGLVEIHAGHADNAIPRESTAIISISEEDFTRLKTTLSTFSTEQREIHKLTDPDLQITASQHDSEIDKRTMRSNDTVAFVRAIHAIPNGVISYSKTIPELVETSTSVGLLKTKFEDDQMMIEVVTMQRSSLDTARRQVGNSIRSIFELARAHEVRTEIEYGGWHPNPDSELVKFAKDSFDGQVKIKATHAGLEAGEIGIRYPHLQMISYGPDIVHAHTPNEKVRIVSVEKMYHFTLRLLERISII